jgi:hypothetical protein
VKLIVLKPEAEHHSHVTADGTDYPHYDVADTFVIDTDAFSEWYRLKWWRKEGSLIHYDSVASLFKEFMEDTIFMSTDLENSNDR